MSPRGPGRRRNVHGQLPKDGEAVNAAHGHQASASAVTFNVSAEGTGMGATARGGASGSGVWTWMATSAWPRPARPAPAPRAPPRPPFRWSPPQAGGGGRRFRMQMARPSPKARRQRPGAVGASRALGFAPHHLSRSRSRACLPCLGKTPDVAEGPLSTSSCTCWTRLSVSAAPPATTAESLPWGTGLCRQTPETPPQKVPPEEQVWRGQHEMGWVGWGGVGQGGPYQKREINCHFLKLLFQSRAHE